jgi:predicted N-acetyltransferase YhbS
LYIGGRVDWQQYNDGLLMHLVRADGPLLDRILDHTYPLWNEGLTREAYGKWNAAQLRTPWGADRLHRFALLDDDGTLMASAKRYRFDVRLDGRPMQMAGIGAVFTPVEQRGRGHAGRLIELLLEQERHEGVALASLFSEIGEAFYRRLGFTCVPLEEADVEVMHKDGSPAMLVRAGDERDLPALAAMHEKRSAEVRFALRRGPALIHYALSKKRLQSGLGPQGLRQTEFYVAEEGASAVAYVLLSLNVGGWTLEEFGDRDPAAARLGAMLQVLIAREPSQRRPLIRTWWPQAFAVPPQVQLTKRVPARDLFMVRSLSPDIVMPTNAADVFYWRSDYF